MASAGKVSPVVKGVWNSAVSYTRLDIVSNATNTRSYIARKDSINVPLENTEYWQILADVADTADKVNYDNTTSKLTATKVQDAIDELAGRKIDIDDTMSDTSTNVVQNKIIKKYADDIDSKYSQLSGRNLLLNSDFRVNQRGGKIIKDHASVYSDIDCTVYVGQHEYSAEGALKVTPMSNGNYMRIKADGSEYGYVKASDVVDGYCTPSQYSIDRWVHQIMVNSNLKVLSNGLEITVQNNDGIWQCLESNLIIGETYTLSCKVDGRILKRTFIFQDTIVSLPYEGEPITGTGICCAFGNRIEDGRTNIWGFITYNNTSPKTYHLEWIKLEKGSIATPYEHPDYNEELARCQAYEFKYVQGNYVTVTYTYGEYNYFSVALPTSLRRFPSLVSISGYLIADGDIVQALNNVSVYTWGQNVVTFKVALPDSRFQNCSVEIDAFELDAEL